MALAEREEPAAVPGGDEVDRVLGRPLEPDPLDERVEVPGVDELRSALVGLGGDEPHERRGPRLGHDPDDLAGLDVRADLDDQFGVAAEGLGVHRGVRLEVGGILGGNRARA